MNVEQNPRRSKSTLAMILGASNYPMSPQLADLPAAANSAEEFHRYFAGIFPGLGLPNENVFNLYNSDETPANQLRIIGEWLTRKQETLKDLIVFYSGRASFTTEIRRLFLATRMTTEPWEGATSIDIEEFSRMLELSAQSARKYLIFDCVFPSRTILDLALPVEGRRQIFPSGNTAVLFSSLEAGIQSEYSAFSNGLFDVLQSSGETQQTRGALSVDDVARRVQKSRFPMHGKRSDLYVFGDLAYVPFFPTANPIQVRFPAHPAGLDKPADKSASIGREKERLEAERLGPAEALLDEDVQFTVYRPREIQPRRWYKMLVFTHLDERPAWLEADEPSPLEQVEEEAERILGPRHESYRKTTDESRLAVPRDGEITFVPEIPGIVFNPPTRSFLWKDGLSVHLEAFELRSEQVSAVPGIARGRVTVFLGHLILAEVAISVRLIDPREAGTLDRETSESSSVRRFRRIFASYSHKDLEIVKEMERYSLSLGDRYLRDWVDLRAGERWDERLLGMISEADIFQLFWSWNSSQSPYVEREWRHAFSLRRETFIRPTYWEDPWPPPPEPLRPIQFQCLEIVKLRAPIVVWNRRIPSLLGPVVVPPRDEAMLAPPKRDWDDSLGREPGAKEGWHLPATSTARKARRSVWLIVLAVIAVIILVFLVFLLRGR